MALFYAINRQLYEIRIVTIPSNKPEGSKLCGRAKPTAPRCTVGIISWKRINEAFHNKLYFSIRWNNTPMYLYKFMIRKTDWFVPELPTPRCRDARLMGIWSELCIMLWLCSCLTNLRNSHDYVSDVFVCTRIFNVAQWIPLLSPTEPNLNFRGYFFFVCSTRTFWFFIQNFSNRHFFIT